MSIFHEKPRISVVKHHGRYIRLDSYVGIRPGMSALYSSVRKAVLAWDSLVRWLADTWTTIALLVLICAIAVGAWSLMHWLTGVNVVSP